MCCHVLRLNELLLQRVNLSLISACEILRKTVVWDVMPCHHVMSMRSPVIFDSFCRSGLYY